MSTNDGAIGGLTGRDHNINNNGSAVETKQLKNAMTKKGRSKKEEIVSEGSFDSKFSGGGAKLGVGGSVDGIANTGSADGLFKTPSKNAIMEKVPKTGLCLTREIIEGSVSLANMIFSAKLTNSPERTLHNCNHGDANRTYLGAGNFTIFKRNDGECNIAVFTNEAGEQKFVSNIPPADNADKHFLEMQGGISPSYGMQLMK